MEYRLVKVKDDQDYIQIYQEDNSELLGSAIFDRKWLLWRQLNLRLEEQSISITNGLFRRRHWKHNQLVISIRSKMLGRKVTVRIDGDQFSADQFVRDKLELTNELGRTGLIIDPGHFKSDDMVLIQHFDRFDLVTSLITSLITLEQYGIW